MANLSAIRSKAEFIGSLNPKAWDALKPHIPFGFTDAHVELMVASVVKNVAGNIAEKSIAAEVMEISKAMANGSATALVSDWEPGDGICPPWRWPFPGPWPGPWVDIFGPHPDPWVPWAPIAAAEQLELAHILTRLSGLTIDKNVNKVLKAAAVKLADFAAKTMLEEFKRCGTVPRKPFPKPR